MIEELEPLQKENNVELEKKLAAITHELDIQSSLEKVREATTKMQRSEDLKEVNLVMLQQMQNRGIAAAVCFIIIMNEAEGSLQFNVANSKTQSISLFKGKISDISVNQKIYDNWKLKSESFVIDMHGEELRNYRDYLKHLGVQIHSDTPASQRAFTMASFSKGLMGVASNEPLSSETINVLERFARVFDGTYTRFLDLQKAEAQAREAQIEAALERVRSQTMAMHKSSELLDVIKLLGDQFQLLGFKIHSANFNTSYRQKDWNLWLYNPGNPVYPEQVHVPYFDHPFFNRTLESIASGSNFHTVVFTKEEKNGFLDHLYAHTIARNSSEERKKFTYDAPGFAWSTVYLKNTALTIANYDAKPYTEEQNAIIRRFGNSFEQAYTRFLDLQKAEAQAREAQIELGLERVRARAMAMHSSSELKEVVQTLFEELTHLDVNLQACLIATFDPVTSDQKSWIIHSKTNEPYSFLIPYNEQPFYQEMLRAWKERNANWSYMLEGEPKINWENFLFNDTEFRLLPKEVKEEMGKPKKVFFAASYYQYCAIQASSPELLSNTSIDILQRFSKVFDSCYTRFLDLKKAESQAREAQIQLALERVRAKTMAMQKPSEFVDVINIIGEQFLDLGFDFDWVNFSANGLDVSKAIDIYNFHVIPGLYQGATRVIIPFFEHPVFKKAEESVTEYQTSGNSFTVVLLGKKDKDTWLDHLFTNTIYKDLPDEAKTSQYNHEVYQTSSVVLKDTWLSIGKYDPKPLTNEQVAILTRLANAFGQTYTRFLDLQKAEAQAREAQIEAGLERVRSRTMGMQKSEELKEVIKIVYQQLAHLEINLDHAGFVVDYQPGGDWHFWIADDQQIPSKITHPYFDSVWANQFNKAKEKRGDFFSTNLNFEEKNKFYTQLLSYVPGLQQASIDFYLSCPGLAVSTVLFDNVSLYIENFKGILYTDEENKILKRFGKVFEQTYTRFLDLQKAEAQAREAQIEAGLERVRSRAMAMQSSEELAPLIGTVFKELTRLDLALTRCVIWIFDPETNGATWWMANSEDAQNPISCDLPYNANEPHLVFLEQWKKRANKFQYELSGAIKKEWDDFLFNKTGLSRLPTVVIEGMKAPGRVFLTASFNNFGALNAATLAPLSDQDLDILLRFAKVFDLTYTRFNDLKQAEAQAREAQIEAALEKVRSRSLAMHKSEELKDLVLIVFEKLKELNIVVDGGVTISIYTEGSRDQVQWVAAPDLISSTRFSLPYKEDKIISDHIQAKESGLDFFAKTYSYEDKNKMLDYLFNDTDFKYVPEEIKNFVRQSESYSQSIAFSKNSSIFINSYSGVLLSGKEAEILKRFAKVFEQAYIRFLDLEKAEAQAREAQIEAALERVRGKAMAMHTSQDLSDTIGTFYQELKSFSLTPMRCGVGLLDKEERIGDLLTWNTTDKGKGFELVGRLKMEGHPVLNKIYERWLSQTEYHPVLHGDEIKEYNKIIKPQMAFPDYKHDDVQFGYFFFFPEGGVYAWTEEEMHEDELQIYRRFTSVLSLTYKRYRDLEKAEASAKEAVKQSALDRIRAEIASMRTISDLDRITPLIWNELTILGVPFIRCGVFIMDDEQQQIHTFLSTPEGKGIAAFHLRYNTPGNIRHVISHWKKKEIYTDHWNEEAFKDFANNLVQQRAMKSSEQYLSTMPAGGFNLHFVPFQQGMLYVGNIAPLDEEEINLLQSIADAFSTAYARYEDFNKLEAAKKQVDNTLTELKQAQLQLVQSEKMASLGELTAGIAHEIQNPLNFVNNFSDVNGELIAEMEIELQNGNVEEAIAIANDIKENEQKINHHGKRADAIVKGMLQHSRKSSGQKEPTDINALADEYLRLSYHGLRAKDKNFNATIETNFDNSIGKINIIPQDIGRVLLNLFNNAFYACTERSRSAVKEQKSSNPISYQPTVFVRTQKCDDKIQITIRDNGNGIPQKIIDKIFQPFFTTKPTGQGTGLGLSLSYDIIKAHGGEIKVESKEGEGSEFHIQLPVTN